MRKLVTWVLALALCIIPPTLGVAASNESEFSIRNGIKFGFTREEVIDIEKRNGFLPNKEETNSIYYTGIEVAGIKCVLSYYFQNNQLSKIGYQGIKKYNDEQYIFLIWEDALTNKYGKPMWALKRKDSCPIFIAEGHIDPDGESVFPGSRWKLSDYNEWLIPVGNGYLKIEQTVGTQTLTMTGLGSFDLSYAHIEYGIFAEQEGKEVWQAYNHRELNATPSPSPSPTPAIFITDDSL